MPPNLGSRAALRAFVLALLALLTLAGCSTVLAGHGTTAASGSASGATPSATLGPQPAANFVDCSDRIQVSALNLPPDRIGKIQFGCATISVPLDYAHPDRTQIQLQLVRVHYTAGTARTGSLLVNPGGPGGSGVELALGIAGQVSLNLLSHFDLIGFDPRGVGLSTPIHCLTDAQKDMLNAASPDIRTPAGFAAARRLAKLFADSCTTKYGAALADYDTVATARDMDLIRQAVGDAKLNYLGFSYGTELGAQYIHLFPANVRVAVLDGAVDPLTDPITSFADQLQGFEAAFDQFAAWCPKQSSCSALSSPRQTVYGLIAKARSTPIPTSTPGDNRKATPNLILTGVLSALYSQAEWPDLAGAINQATHGDSAGLLDLADRYNQRQDGHYSNISDANTTINCNDSQPGPSDATIRQTVQAWVRRFPMFGLYSAPGLFSCQPWQPDRTVPPLPSAPTAAHRVLVIGNLHDPATPYQGAKDLTRTLGNAELLTWDGEGHTSFLQGSTCVDRYVDAYLISGTLPPSGTTCPR